MVVFSLVLLPTAIIITSDNNANTVGTQSDEYISDADKYDESLNPTNYLLYLSVASEDTADTFILFSFIESQQTVYVQAIPETFSISQSSDVVDLDDVHDSGGYNAVSRAIESAFNVTIEKTSYLTKDAFTNILNSLGSINYYIEKTVALTDSVTNSTSTVLQKGNHFIDSDMFINLLSHSNNLNTESLSTKQSLFLNVFLQKGTEILSNDQIFSDFISLSSGNVNALDYQRLKHTLEPLFEASDNHTPFAQTVSPNFTIVDDIAIISEVD